MEADMGLTTQAFEGRSNRFNQDDRLFVRFYKHPVENPKRSAEEGRPIFEERDFITIMVPGNKSSTVIREVRDNDKQRFPRQYQAYKANEDQNEAMSGTPLAAWPGISRAEVEELKFFNIVTVEQLADLSDTHAQQFMGINMLKQRAQAFLDAAADNAVNEKMAAELEKRDNEIGALNNTISAQSKKLDELADELEALKAGE